MQNEQPRIDLKTFNKNFDITRNGRVVEKTARSAAVHPVRHIADGAIFDRKCSYYFFDENSLTVRESAGLVSVGEYLTGANNFKIVLICRLHSSKDSALSDGQEYLKTEVKRLSELIAKFELEKATKATV